jgi:hypothetical protein
MEACASGRTYMLKLKYLGSDDVWQALNALPQTGRQSQKALSCKGIKA